MPIRKLSFVTVVLFVIALSAAPFSGHTLPQADGVAFAQAQPGQPANLNTASDKETPTDAAVVLYRVTGVVLVIWIGLAVYLFRIDRKLSKLGNELRGRK